MEIHYVFERVALLASWSLLCLSIRFTDLQSKTKKEEGK
jgi:hypothetical protein